MRLSGGRDVGPAGAAALKHRAPRRSAGAQSAGSRMVLTMAIALVAIAGAAGGTTSRGERLPLPPHEVHALWVHPPDIGRTRDAQRAFLDHAERANIDTLLVLVKGMSGELYFKSRRFPEAVARGFQDWDVLAELTPEAHKRGMSVHAWFVDFAEGEHGAAITAHPEWAQLNPDGRTTASEVLGADRPYPYVWMCPARRPGYVDQWLLPLFEEVVRTYDVDGVHHDYVRYPGDVAPDSYCFDDYCLSHLPRYAMLRYESLANERYRVMPVQQRIEANWWRDPTMLPQDWDELDRREKADYLLNGRTVPGGPPDMRYFFYDFRIHQIDRFVREATELVKRINPEIEVSASVFKNPVQSGRFIGQQWHAWTPWIDFYTPMTYRSHFAGDFEAYLAHLTETTARQIEWTRHVRPIHAGIATSYLFREELEPIDEMREALQRAENLPAARSTERHEAIATALDRYAHVRTAIERASPERARAIAPLVEALEAQGADPSTEAIAAAAKAAFDLRFHPPEGYLPPAKLTQSIEAARKAHPDGIAIFSAGTLTREHLWPALEAAFGKDDRTR